MKRNFLVGAATAAHQVEGNNIHSDFWAQESMKHSIFDEPSLEADDHYHRFREDIDLLKRAGLNAYRFSVEWARIEPEKDRFDEDAIRHYAEVLSYCKESGITPIVTLHHFSSPLWLIREGGWESEGVVERFQHYADHVVKRLGDEMPYICTINEANMGLALDVIKRSDPRRKNADLQIGINYDADEKVSAAREKENREIFGTAVPQTFLEMRTERGDELIMRSHCAARSAIKERHPEIKVGVTLSLHDFQPESGAEQLAEEEWRREFSHYLPYIQVDDFVGIQNYTRKLVGKDGFLPAPPEARKTQMRYEYYPEALENVIRKVYGEARIPVLVTENGVAVENDKERVEFVRRSAEGVQRCIKDGIPVLGYLYWSLLDNFEWQKGYQITFGLIGVDRETKERHPRESLYELAKCYQA